MQEPPIDPSSLTHWRQRLGKDGIEDLLAVTISEVVEKNRRSVTAVLPLYKKGFIQLRLLAS